MRRYDELHKQARDYVKRLEELMGCPIDIISIGPQREESITIRPIPQVGPCRTLQRRKDASCQTATADSEYV